MRLVAPAVLFVAALSTVWELTASSNHPETSAATVDSNYDSNPSHLWNRLYAALLVRKDRHGTQFGADSLDPLLWPESEQLLERSSHERALRVLDESLQTHGENLIHDPLKRVMLQRDLWAVFDWSVTQFPGKDRPQYDKEKRELQIRLAEVLRRLGLTSDEITSLPDTYSKAVASGAFAREYDPAHPENPFLPADLFDPHGPWVCIQPSPESDSGVAKVHVFSVSGRSGFLVFVRLPEGRKATMDYFQSLWSFPQPWVGGPSFAADQTMENPELPSFPAGTQVALVRRLNAFDSQGALAATPIVESVQIRVYRAITSAEERNFGNGNLADITKNSGQLFYEFELSRPLLFSGKNGGLRAIAADEKEFSTFQSKGDDPFEERSGGTELRGETQPELQRCVWCHNGGGVRSLNSRSSLLKPNRMQQEPQNPDYGPLYWGNSATLDWKGNRFDWGLLNGYWRASTAIH
jgi:hypothetical protein